MIMTPGLRRFALTVHVTFSVGWIGAVVAFLALVVAAMTSQDAHRLRAAWIAMELTGWFAIVPLSLGTLLTGLVMSLGTNWGLFRHYWVLISFVLTILATVVLLGNMQAVSFFAGLAAETGSADVGRLRGGLGSELLHAGVGLLVLLVIQVLNVYKPRGMTPYGRRKQQEQRQSPAIPGTAPHTTREIGDKSMADLPSYVGAKGDTGGHTGSTSRWMKVLPIIVIALVLLFVVLHLTGGGVGGMHRP
jgi:hypothetical protein